MFSERLSQDQLRAMPGFDDHEQVHFFSDEATGLRALIAIHDRTLGPAAGGCRFWPYADRQEALDDVLRLSKAMSFKNAMAGLPLGGGKAVVWSDGDVRERAAFFAAFGRAVASLNGAYITAEDVGTRVTDMQVVAEQTDYVCGLPVAKGEIGGDPSPATARGVFLGLKSAVRFAMARSDLAGVRVAVQGLGGVGFNLCRELHGAGAQLVISDINQDTVSQALDEFGCRSVAPERLLETEADVLAPCALGGVLNKTTIANLNTKIVAGAANNQLANDQDGELLRLRGILYAPDYVINAGGIIQVAAEYFDWSREEVEDRIAAIPMSLQQIFEESSWRHRSTNKIADTLALTRLQSGAGVKAAV